MWRALAIMAATGLVLVIGEPGRELGATSFWLKMALLAVAVGTTVWLGRGSGGAATRPAAVGLIALWMAIIFLGRTIAYDVEIWQSLSLHA